MRIVLPYPHRVLWPNGRTKVAAYRNSLFQQHKEWAYYAAKAQGAFPEHANTVPIRIIVHPKPRGPHPDKDGVIGACKAYLDGISKAIGINDRYFAAPLVEFADTRTGEFVVEVGE